MTRVLIFGVESSMNWASKFGCAEVKCMTRHALESVTFTVDRCHLKMTAKASIFCPCKFFDSNCFERTKSKSNLVETTSESLKFGWMNTRITFTLATFADMRKQMQETWAISFTSKTNWTANRSAISSRMLRATCWSFIRLWIHHRLQKERWELKELLTFKEE